MGTEDRAMKSWVKWTATIGLGLLGAAVVATGGVYAASEVIRHQQWPKLPVTIEASRDPGATARGARLATVYGCHDCHGADMAGRRFHDEPALARISGANLTLAAAHQSDADLARAIRTGVAADGRGLWVMPSAAFSRLTDAETADLIAHLRTFKPHGEPSGGIQMGPVGRLGVVLSKFSAEPQKLRDGVHDPLDLGPVLAQGRSMTRACAECHGVDLKGEEAAHAPDLAIAASYPLADFKRLMRTGVAAGDRKLPLMSQTAVSRFSGWSDEEIAALHAYLKARAERVLVASR
jgi:cytochrome c553